jgi:hypothetical protein
MCAGDFIISKLLFRQPAKISAGSETKPHRQWKKSAIVKGSEMLAIFIEDSCVIRASNYSSDEERTPAINETVTSLSVDFGGVFASLLSAAGASLSHVDGDKCLQRKERLLLRPRSKHRSNFLFYGTSAPATSKIFLPAGGFGCFTPLCYKSVLFLPSGL